MTRIRINRAIVATLILLLIQTSVLPWLVPSAWSGRLLLHLPFVMTVFVALLGGRHRAFLFGLGFGWLEDTLFYGHMIGPYAFGMALIGYLIGLAFDRRLNTLAFVLLLAGVGSGLLDMLAYFIYKLFSLTHLSASFVFYWQVLPTLLLHMLAVLALYLPARRFLVRQIASQSEEADVV
ncbi:rod shape-determining protein MreD [Cohnella sp. JJ-181]|uniref:rod shape-determining protein MreD n=1 Tax=Cohnella rhizoplanae TaxID=2974897 RepID=UPI0022FF5CC3|nr:rod shape-determining protein MreD [Cohnella sp. JJ-181]CAI6082358.1 hypothetical protein COHCIP112018_03617 [Cohnella sp. JJ-181]